MFANVVGSVDVLRIPEFEIFGFGVAGAAVGTAIVAIACLRGGWGLARSLAAGSALALVVAVMVITLAPVGVPVTQSCLLVPREQLLDWGDPQRLLNVLMFVPIGFSTGLAAANGRQRALVVPALIGLTLGIEAMQATPFVQRACDATDVFDNAIGAAVGVAASAIVYTAVRMVRADMRRSFPSPGLATQNAKAGAALTTDSDNSFRSSEQLQDEQAESHGAVRTHAQT